MEFQHTVCLRLPHRGIPDRAGLVCVVQATKQAKLIELRRETTCTIVMVIGKQPSNTNLRHSHTALLLSTMKKAITTEESGMPNER
jgi:hypothetical protein